MSFLPFVAQVVLHLCPSCGDLVCEDPVPGEHDGIVCAGPLGHIVIERPREDER